MREKMLEIARELHQLADSPGVDIQTPSQTIRAIAEAIEHVLGEPTFRCRLCGERFVELPELNTHITLHHGIESYRGAG